jgi:hypothetical protein
VVVVVVLATQPRQASHRGEEGDGSNGSFGSWVASRTRAEPLSPSSLRHCGAPLDTVSRRENAAAISYTHAKGGSSSPLESSKKAPMWRHTPSAGLEKDKNNSGHADVIRC